MLISKKINSEINPVKYFKKPNKSELIVTFCIFIWILLVNILSVALGVHGWPMFFVTIFFYVLHADLKQLPNIFAGATLGLGAAVLLAAGMRALTPATEELGAFAIMITIILGVIILGGTVAPVCCNNVAFAYLTAATITISDVSVASILNNLLVLYIGGGIILGGAVMAGRLGMKIASRRPRP